MPERGRESAVLSDDGCMASVGGRTCYVPRDSERKARREIANSNERRRMQSINAGFQALRKMLQPRDGDKLSKASILQKAVERICSLEQERSYLIACNDRLTRRLRAIGRDICEIDDEDDDFARFSSISSTSSSVSKRRKLDTESSDEGIGGMLSAKALRSELTADVPVISALRRQIVDLQQQLEHERRMSAEFVCTDATQQRSRSVTTGPFSSSNAGTPRRGSLETIVEAIRCLEGDEKAETKPLSSELCRPAGEGEDVVVAAAEALQFIATGPRGASSSSSMSACWRGKSDISNDWQGCR